MSQALIQPIYLINIAGATINSEYLDCDITIEMSTSIEPDTFQIKIYNVDPITQVFITKGSLVSISLGYASGLIGNLMTGIITNISHEDTDSEQVIIVEGIDAMIYYLKKKDVHVSYNSPQEVISLIRNICLSAGVSVSAIPTASGIIVENYSVENKNAFETVKELVKRIGYNATSKGSLLYITNSLTNGQIAAAITEELAFKLTKIAGVKQDNKSKVDGYNFYGTGIPTLMPLKLVTVAMLEDKIAGNFVVETVVHKFNSKTGYICYGSFFEPSMSIESVDAYRYPSPKNLASTIGDKIVKSFETKPNLDTGEVEQVFTNDRTITSKFGVNPAKNKNITTPSIQSDLGVNNVFSVKKPMASLFAGDGYGIIVPVYKGNRAVLGFNRFDMQDANILGFLWKKGWIIPAHDSGEFQIHMKNHSKISMKEDGSAIIQAKSLKLQIGSTNLTVSKPSKTDDGKLLIEFDDASELSYKNGTGWKLKTSGNVVVEGATVKLGENASLGVARLNDPVVLDSGLLTWMNTHTHPTAATGPPSPPTVGHSGTDAGTIKTASNKVKSE